jgi:DNA-binding response OmpR family regulator
MAVAWIVDDDEEMSHAVRLMLELLEFRVETFREPRAAAKALLAGAKPTVLILDINMPEVSGMDMLEFLRTRTELGRIPVVMLSSETTDAQVDAALQLGADAFAFKPVSIEELQAALRKALVGKG